MTTQNLQARRAAGGVRKARRQIEVAIDDERERNVFVFESESNLTSRAHAA